jgi:propanediol dehydratase small subunit
MSIVAILVLLVVAWSALSIGQLPHPLRARTCQGRLWRRAFPSASKKQISDFLSLCTDAFAFRDVEKLKFRPDDQLLSIYRALSRSKWMPDALEFETLANGLRTRYGVALGDIWDERMTLGALFSHVQQTKRGVAPRAAA